MTMVLVPSHPMALRVRHVPPSRSAQAPRERLSASVKLFPNVYDCVRSLRAFCLSFGRICDTVNTTDYITRPWSGPEAEFSLSILIIFEIPLPGFSLRLCNPCRAGNRCSTELIYSSRQTPRLEFSSGRTSANPCRDGEKIVNWVMDGRIN